MDCKSKEHEFNSALKQVQTELENELTKIAEEAERKSEQLEQEFDEEQDLGEGVGATAGTVVGGTFGGPAGAVIGGTVGKTIGSLFTIQTGYSEERISLHIPTVELKEQSWNFDVPSVKVKDNDIILNMPTLVMRTVPGPRIPHSTTRMKTECVYIGIKPFGKEVCTDVPQTTVTWEQTYLDVPTYENRKHRIVIGIPEVTMKEQEVIVSVPEIKMEQTDLIFRIPSITIKFIKDAGKKITKGVEEIASAAASQSEQKRLAMKGRIITEVIEPAKAMFECYKNQLQENRSKILSYYDPEIEKLRDTLKVIKSKGIPKSDDDYKSQESQLNNLITKREEAVSTIDTAVKQLDESSKKAIESLLNI